MEEQKIIYRIEIPSIEELTQKVDTLTSKIEQQKEAKREASKVALANPSDTAVVERQNHVIAESELAIKRYSDEKRIAAKESDALSKTQASFSATLRAMVGSLSENINLQTTYKIRLSEISKELKELDKNTTDAEKKSDSYKTKVSELVKEQQNLKVATSEIAQTIKTQVKESQAAEGSYDQLSQRLGLMKDLFRQLNAEEKASPFGRELVKDIDILDAKLKEEDARIGNFQRNVGNYQQSVLTAFKDLGLTDVLKNQKKDIEAQLTTIIAKNKELAAQFKVTGKEGVDAFNKVEKELKDNITTQQKLEGNLRQINGTLQQQGGIGSQVLNGLNSGFKNILSSGLSIIGLGFGLSGAFSFLSSSVDEFLQADTAAARLRGTLENLGRTDAFSRLNAKADELVAHFKFLDNDDVVEVFTKLIDYGKLTEAQMNDLLPVIVNFAAKARIPIQEAADVILKALEGQGRALKTYGINLKTTGTEADNLQVIMTTLKDKVEGAGDAFQNSAAGGIAKSKQELANLKEEIGSGITPALAFLLSLVDKSVKGWGLLAAGVRDFFKILADPTGFKQERKAAAAEEADKILENDLNQTAAVYVRRYQEAIKLKQTTLTQVLSNLEDSLDNPNITDRQKRIDQKILDLLNPTTLGINGGGDDEKAKAAAEKVKAAAEKARKEAEQRAKDEMERRLRVLEANSIAERIALEQQRRDNLVSEEGYQKALFEIDKKGIVAKQKIYDEAKGLDLNTQAEVKRARQQLSLDLVNEEIANQEKLFSIRKAALERQKNLDEQAAKDVLDKVLNNRNANASEKEAAQEAFDTTLLDIQRRFNVTMLTLEKDLHQKETDAVIARNQKIKELELLSKDDSAKTRKANLDDIIATGEQDIAEFETIINRQREIIVNSSRSQRSKTKALTALDNQEEIGILAREVASMKIQLPVYEQQLKNKEISEQDYADKYAAYVAKLQQLNNLLIGSNKEASKSNPIPSQQNTQDILQGGLRDLFQFDKGSDNDKLLGEAISQSFDLANQAMNDYFNAEEARINHSKDLALERLDTQRKQELFLAQSQAERASIEDQYAEKRRNAEREAGERLKKVKKDEAKIALATELSYIAVAAAQNPLNGITFGGAGIAMYATLGAIALGRYLLAVKNIDATTFAGGGKAKKLENGLIRERPNMQTLPNGDNIFAIVKAGEVILNEAQQKRLGGPSVFKAIGVPGFADGGIAYKPFAGGGIFGDNLQAPVNPQSYLNNVTSGMGSDQIEALMGMVAQTNDSISKVSGRIDNLQVHIVTRSMRSAIDKEVKNESIGTL